MIFEPGNSSLLAFIFIIFATSTCCMLKYCVLAFQPYGGYGDIAKFAQGKSTGGPNMKTTSFAAPLDDGNGDRSDVDPSKSMRRKVKPRDSYRPAPIAKPPPSR